MVDETAIRGFLSTLWPDGIRDDCRGLIWTLPSKVSGWVTGVDGATLVAARATPANDVYVGCGLGPAGISTRKRALIGEIRGIPGLWADLDYLDGDAHKKANLPTQAEAVELIDLFATSFLVPTVVVHSGHGYQVWWLFDSPWYFETPSERDQAIAVERGLVARLRRLAGTRGWDVDATVDLARVMRVPGTLNHKTKPAVPVTLVEPPGPRHSRETVVALLSAEVAAVTRQRAVFSTVDERDLVLDESAEPPFGKFEALRENAGGKFAATWNRSRRDLQDQSASAYDLAIANFAAAAEWSDQEIADLLIARRRKHGDDLKLRADYYAMTIARARGERTVERAAEVSSETPVAPEDARAALSLQFFPNGGVSLEGIQKYSGDPPTYTLSLRLRGEVREVTLGTVDAILNQAKFRAAVASTANVIPTSVGRQAWETRAQALLNIQTEHDLGPEVEPAGAARSWITSYLDAHRPERTDATTAMRAKAPYVYDGFVCITLSTFAQWLRQIHGERITTRELARYLRMAGWEAHAQWIASGGKKSTGTTWSVWRTKDLDEERT